MAAPRPATRSGWRCGRKSCASTAERPAGEGLNAVAGIVLEIGYRGDMSIYKVRLADRSMMKVALANTGARPAGIRRQRSGVAVVAARCRRGADGIADGRQLGQTNGHPGARERCCCCPMLWLLLFFLAPFVIVLKISLSQTVIAQPPYVPVLDLAAGWQGVQHFVAG